MIKRAALAILLLPLLVPAAARADGPPVGGSAFGGVTLGAYRYVALPAPHGTLLERLTLKGAEPTFIKYLHYQVGVPMVALDGTPGGISHDGRTLVLSQIRTSYPERTSRLYLVNPRTFTLRKTITLHGDFSYDAISPDGGTLYLIQLSRRDFTKYAVRALDTRSGRLDPKPVVDATEPDEVMRGMPYARVTSPDGRFSYTLYSGGEKPFVHALDTVAKKAACIDLPQIPANVQPTLRLHGQTLTVLGAGRPIAYVNVPTRHVSNTPPPAPREQSSANGGGAGGALWPLAGALGALALGATAALAARRRRAGAVRS